ncbi:MAG: hypothetical protein ACRDYA_13465 [Egibacteraceae bacterium]
MTNRGEFLLGKALPSAHEGLRRLRRMAEQEQKNSASGYLKNCERWIRKHLTTNGHGGKCDGMGAPRVRPSPSPYRMTLTNPWITDQTGKSCVSKGARNASSIFSKVLSRAFGAVLLVLMVAVVARAAYWLLAPLVPVLVALIVIGCVYWFIFRKTLR